MTFDMALSRIDNALAMHCVLQAMPNTFLAQAYDLDDEWLSMGEQGICATRVMLKAFKIKPVNVTPFTMSCETKA